MYVCMLCMYVYMYVYRWACIVSRFGTICPFFFFSRLRLYDYVLRVTICRSLLRSEANSFIHPSVRTHTATPAYGRRVYNNIVHVQERVIFIPKDDTQRDAFRVASIIAMSIARDAFLFIS